ncbi:efflux transporter, outer membrane factor (OMF) lipoprotein, NodT family [Noviherbaspirillum humi]|uniref:Efflux transporter, outer membrane factor (OMF) lipoprotein, NodT family n=1 Tax=Noviherbaspirillum humi TaxID=1688639 RepID=A0A239IPR8_9BURK|nr:efflux transporter outer membrane subunit [Noviherbaspirillum humi]SNS95208.1 efflux transporter, outer membrane factor (OMF) lipoprotein, NodT family [Noviherbaspirillum humi]
MIPPLPSRAALALLATLFTGGCAVGPAYERPAVPMTANFKEAQGWVPAAPADAVERGKWWQLFQDPVLNELEEAVAVSNQNIAAAVAAYQQARAVVGQQRATLFPSVVLDGGVDRSGGRSSSSSSAGNRGTSYQASIGASWEVDVWGRLREAVNNASAGAEASAADIATARLSAQGELAVDYLTLRQLDAQIALLREAIEGYGRVLQINQNRYDAGVAARTDVLQAQTQLANTQAEEAGLVRQRAQLEHAIAVLIGKPPAEFSLAPQPWQVTVPAVPAGMPSTLLQRRPDVAAAERRVAAANAQIGIARAAYFPSLALNASYGSTVSSVAELFAASSSLWALGLSTAQTVFNAGATRERVAGAEALREQTIARYRQTVLTAFQDVEDALSAAQVLARQQEFRRQASQSADLVETQQLNRYRAGQIGYTDVVTAQVTALNARRALVQVQADRQTSAVALLQALGGSWD